MVDNVAMERILEMIYIVFKAVLFFPFKVLQMMPNWLAIIFKVIFSLLALFFVLYMIKNRDEWRKIDC